ncbi:MAG: TonB-dependent receptor [Flavobacteriales bacterium]|nr:TonB-dependent receptor [Flavobacteriales bacterium]
MRNCSALVAFLLLVRVFAQEATISGVVRDANTKQALIGVNVVYAPGKGNVTDVDGRYTLSVPAGEHVLTFTYVGYTTATTTVVVGAGERKEVDRTMNASATQLDMVVISAGKFEQRVGEVTQSLSILRPDLIRNKNIVSLSDALDQVPGVVIVDEEPQIRAGSGFSYGAGSRVQVLVDNVPILSGDVGRPNWSFLPIENLEQVEVIKGASSVLYGSAALSGVINVRTAYPRDKPRTRVTVFSGMYDAPLNAKARWWGDNNPMFGGANFSHAQKFGKFDLVLGGQAFNDNGYIGPEPQAPDSITADPLRTGPGGYENRVRFNLGTRWRNGKVKGLSYGINANAMKSRSTSVFIWNDVEDGLYRPKSGTVTRTKGAQYYVDPYIDYLSNAGTRHTVRTRFHRQEFDNDNDQSNSNSTYHAEYQVQQKVDLFGEMVLTGGLVWRQVDSEAQLYSGGADSSGVNSATNSAAYLQVDKKIIEKIMVSAGVRYEQFVVNNAEAARPVFRAGANYQVFKATYLRASYGQGFRFPTIGERFISTNVGALRVYPNPDLRPEQSWNVEGGIKQGFKLGRFVGYVDAVVFQQDFENYVEFTFGQWSTFEWATAARDLYGFGFKSVNTGGARVSGFELELAGKGQLGPVELSALIGYTSTNPVSTTPDQVYADPVPGPPLPFPPGNTTPSILIPASTFTNTSYDPANNILKFRIQQLFRMDLQAEYKRFFLGGSVRYNSHVRNIEQAFIELDDNGLLQTGVREWMDTHRSGDTILDGRIGLTFPGGIRAAFIVNNLTNRSYSMRPLAIEAPRSFQVQLGLDIGS